MQNTDLTNYSSFLIWSGLECVRTWMRSLWGSQQLFPCVLGHFRHGDTQTTNQPTNWMILVQACSWPKGSLLQYRHRFYCFSSVKQLEYYKQYKQCKQYSAVLPPSLMVFFKSELLYSKVYLHWNVCVNFSASKFLRQSPPPPHTPKIIRKVCCKYPHPRICMMRGWKSFNCLKSDGNPCLSLFWECAKTKGIFYPIAGMSSGWVKRGWALWGYRELPTQTPPGHESRLRPCFTFLSFRLTTFAGPQNTAAHLDSRVIAIIYILIPLLLGNRGYTSLPSLNLG